jgi:hypothetical protein
MNEVNPMNVTETRAYTTAPAWCMSIEIAEDGTKVYVIEQYCVSLGEVVLVPGVVRCYDRANAAATLTQMNARTPLIHIPD